VVDGLEYIYNSVAFLPILNDAIDSGFVEGLNRWTGNSAERLSPGYDTNNSTVDFVILTHPTPGVQHETRIPYDPPMASLLNEMRLQGNYPNPFNSETVIPFSVGSNTREVRISISDILGRTVREFRFKSLPPGEHVVRWDSNDERGAPLSSGAYFVRLEGGGDVQTKTMLLLK